LTEAIVGLPEFAGSSSIPMNTSCGYPYMVEGIRKTDLLDENLQPSQRLQTDYYNALQKLENGNVPFLPFILTIKDERLPLAKIYTKPKSRLFANGNIVHFLLSRTYLLTELLMHYDDCANTFMTVGVDRLSVAWDELIQYLREAGENGFDGDYKNWDRSLCKVVMSLAVEIMLEPLNLPEMEKKAVIEFLAVPNYIYRWDVFRGQGSMASGGLITYNANCICNEMLHRSAYLKIMKTLSPIDASIKVYREKQRGKRGGDDTMQLVHASHEPYFNAITFGQWLTERGMVYTAADKSEANYETKHFTDLSFLKNKTKKERGFYVPLSDLESLKEMTNWIRLNKYNQDPIKATEDNCNAALRGYYFYGSELFNSIRQQLMKKEPRLNLYTYDDLKTIWGTYFYFPGSHSDYSTRVDQLGLNQSYVRDLYTKDRLRYEQNESTSERHNQNEHDAARTRNTINDDQQHTNSEHTNIRPSLGVSSVGPKPWNDSRVIAGSD
jgi:hypothetical protein